VTSECRAEIFAAPAGDGTVQDLIPGTHVGSFGRGIDASNVNNILNTYDNTVALHLTPAGQVLLQIRTSSILRTLTCLGMR